MDAKAAEGSNIWAELLEDEPNTTLWQKGDKRVYLTESGRIGIEVGNKSIDATPEQWHEMVEELSKRK